jgi:hypothetical protein
VGNIGFIEGYLPVGGLNLYLFTAKLKIDNVPKIQAAHQRKQFMETVRSFSGDLQK